MYDCVIRWSVSRARFTRWTYLDGAGDDVEDDKDCSANEEAELAAVDVRYAAREEEPAPVG